MQTANITDSDYMSETTLTALEALPESADTITALRAACDALTGCEDFGIDCEVAVTHETLADFLNSRKNNWSVRGEMSEHAFGNFPVIVFKQIQLEKGTRRHSLAVIDFGDIRAALTA